MGLRGNVPQPTLEDGIWPLAPLGRKNGRVWFQKSLRVWSQHKDDDDVVALPDEPAPHPSDSGSAHRGWHGALKSHQKCQGGMWVAQMDIVQQLLGEYRQFWLLAWRIFD